MLLNSRQFKFLKNYKNVYVKSSARRDYRDENVFLKGDRALSKLITLWISNKKEFNNFFKSRSSDIVLLKLGNLHQNVKRYVCVWSAQHWARSATTIRSRALGAPFLAREAHDKNMQAKRADFLFDIYELYYFPWQINLTDYQ